MTISIAQAAILGIFACLSSLPGMGGTTFGNYTLGRPLVAGLICGIVLGNIPMGVLLGTAVQVVYIALVTPGGTVSADVRAVSYIGIPLAMVYVATAGLDPSKASAQQMAVTLASTVGTLGTVLFYGTATMNLVWQHMGWRDVEKGKLKNLYRIDMVYPWISHILFSFLPTFIILRAGSSMVKVIQNYLPMDGIPMKTLFTLGSLLPAVGVAILLKQVVGQPKDFLTFFFGFTLSGAMGVNLIGCAVVGGFFAVLHYEIRSLSFRPAAAVSTTDDDDDDDEEI